MKKNIKKALDILMVKTVQKQLSWSGIRTTKPSFELEYNQVVQVMQFALKEHHTDYDYETLQTKIKTLLQGA